MPIRRLASITLLALTCAACGGGGGGDADERGELRLDPAVPHELVEDTSAAFGFVVNDQGIGASAFASLDIFQSVLNIRPFDAAQGFATPVPVHTGSFVSMDRRRGIAVNANGRGVIAWREFGFTDSDVKVRLFDARTGALGPTRILDDTVADSFEPQVAIDPLGRVVVVWTQRAAGGNERLLGAGYTPSQGWSPAILVEPSLSRAFGAELAIGPTGDALVAWTLKLGDDFAARGRAWRNGAWGIPHSMFLQAGKSAQVVDVLVGDDGESTALFTISDTATLDLQSLRAKRHRPSVLPDPGWQPVEVVDPTIGDHMRVDAVRLEGGDLLAVYGVDTVPNTAAVLRASRFTSGAGWSAPFSLTDLPLLSFDDLSLRALQRGPYVLVDYGRFVGGGAERRATLLRDGLPVWKDRLIPSAFNGRPPAALDEDGNAYLAVRGGAGGAALDLFRLRASGTLDGPAVLESGIEGIAEDAFVAVDAAGRGAAVWVRLEQDPPDFHGDVFHVLVP